MALDDLRDTLERGKRLAVAGETHTAALVLHRLTNSCIAQGAIATAADALDWLAWLSWVELDGSRARWCARKMLGLEVPAGSAAAFRAYVRKASASLQLGDAQQALRIIEKAETASNDADIDAFTAYLSQKADVYSALGEPEAALSYARLAVDIASKRNSVYHHWRCVTYLAYTLQAMGNLPEASGAYERAERLARQSGLTWEPAMVLARRAWVTFLAGKCREARDMCARAFEVRAEQRWMVAHRAWVAMLVGSACDDRELVERAADETLIPRALGSRDAYTIGPIAAAFSMYYRSLGRDREAEELIREALRSLRSPDAMWPLFPQIAAYGGAETMHRARELLARFPESHTVAQAHRLLFDATVAQRHGDAVAAEGAAAQARLLFESGGCAYYAAHCSALSGRLTEAQHAFAAMGCSRDARLLESSRVGPGRPRNTYERLRQREEIVRLLLGGHTNASIARRLGVSLRTVKNRVAEIYGEHGVSSRPALLAARQGSPRRNGAQSPLATPVIMERL